MQLPKYQLKSSEDLTSYEFVSEGKRGLIVKRIQFTLINRDNVYNLAFGDKNLESGEIDDLVISDNGDSTKVLATVVSSVYAFCEKNANSWIFAVGSTPARTRLYQKGIAKYFDFLTEEFEIFGQTNERWEPFEIGKNYNAFLGRRK